MLTKHRSNVLNMWHPVDNQPAVTNTLKQSSLF